MSSLVWDKGSEFLNVLRNDANGQTERSVLFDPDDVDAAVAELDRIHAECDDPLETRS